MRFRRRWLVVAAGLMVIVVAVVAVAVSRFGPPAVQARCRLAVAQAAFVLDLEQAANVTTIAAVGKRLGLPDHAATVAIAAALQESGLHNLDHGDLDSIGLFQQRPSQGWGTTAQIMTPRYARMSRSLLKFGDGPMADDEPGCAANAKSTPTSTFSRPPRMWRASRCSACDSISLPDGSQRREGTTMARHAADGRHRVRDRGEPARSALDKRDPATRTEPTMTTQPSMLITQASRFTPAT